MKILLINYNKKMFIDSSLIINVDYYKTIEKDVKCPICSGIINQPIQCDSCKHNMCKEFLIVGSLRIQHVHLNVRKPS